MAATKHLRELLDKRGVKHTDYENNATWWSNGNVECAYIQSVHDKLGHLSFMATPEQAIEATLGEDDDYVSVQKIIDDVDKMVTKYKIKIALKDYFEEWRGTCAKVREWEDDPRGGGGWVLVCSECDEFLANDGEDGKFDGPNFCPNCGRRIVRGEV